MITGWKVRALLAQRGVAADESQDWLLLDLIDGAGVRIARWDEAKLGPEPSEAELDALQAEADILRAETVATKPDNKLEARLNALPPTPLRDALLIWLADRKV